MPGLKPGQKPKRISDEDKQKMHDMVVIHGKSRNQVAKEMDCTRDTVSRAVKDRMKLGDEDRPVDTEDLVKLNRDVYRKINRLIGGFSDKALEKSNVYQVAGAISMLTGVLKDLTKLTGDRLDEALPEDIDIRDRVGRLEGGLQKLSKLSGRIHQEKIREAELEERAQSTKTGPKAEA
jgi:hypothetical protein